MDDLDEFLHCFGYADGTRRQYRTALDRFGLDVVSPETLSPVSFERWLRDTGWGESQRWVAFCAVKKYLRWKYGERHPALKLRIKRVQAGPQRVLKLDEVGKLLQSFDTSTATGRRDLSICTMALDTGLRAAEICSLETRRVDLQERSLWVRIKGGEWSKAVYSAYTASCGMSWLADRERLAHAGVATFYVGVGGLTPGERMTTGGLRALMRRWAVRAGLPALSPHDLRRTMATIAVRLGAPSRVVQAAGRWKSLEMVEHYTQSIEPEDMEPWSPVMGAMTRKP